MTGAEYIKEQDAMSIENEEKNILNTAPDEDVILAHYTTEEYNRYQELRGYYGNPTTSRQMRWGIQNAFETDFRSLHQLFTRRSEGFAEAYNNAS